MAPERQRAEVRASYARWSGLATGMRIRFVYDDDVSLVTVVKSVVCRSFEELLDDPSRPPRPDNRL